MNPNQGGYGTGSGRGQKLYFCSRQTVQCSFDYSQQTYDVGG